MLHLHLHFTRTHLQPLQQLAYHNVSTSMLHHVLTTRAHSLNFVGFEDSRLGNSKFHRGACRVVKITVELDARSHKAMELIRLVCHQSKGRIVIWASLPCTGGCTWNYINRLNPGGEQKIDEHVALMTQLLSKFITAARLVLSAGGIVCFEWPHRCTYWKRDDVQYMIRTLRLRQTLLCGCALGLRSIDPPDEFTFIKKPWCVYSNSGNIHQILSKFSCPGVSDKHKHEQCRGKNAKKSERYTDAFAYAVHRALRTDFSDV